MNLKAYRNFEVEDFVQDEHFRSYIVDHNLVFESEWKELQQQYPHLVPKIEEATQILRTIEYTYQNYRNEGVKRAPGSYQHLQSRLEKRKKQVTRKFLWAGGIAATFVLAVFSITFLFSDDHPNSYVTADGESMEILLPDNSIVYLKENSSLSLRPDWDEKSNRQVELVGEAYFMISKYQLPSGEKVKFNVQSGTLNIEVLGTQFNVENRFESTNVVLDEGSVRLSKKKDDSPIYMTPGEVATYHHNSENIEVVESALVEKVDLRPETIQFNQISLRDAMRKMSTIYNIKFNVVDNEMLNWEIDKLSIPTKNPNAFFETIKLLSNSEISFEFDSESNSYILLDERPIN